MSLPLSLDIIRDLAPTEMISHRVTRSLGNAVSVPLEAFLPTDRKQLQHLYRTLLDLLALLERQQAHTNSHDEIVAFAKARGWSELLQGVQRIGAAMASAQQTPPLRAVLHDIRGGSFQALSMMIQLALLGYATEIDARRLFFLTRDHLKMMRNAIPDLDPPRYARDLSYKLHGAALLVEKWSNVTHTLETAAAHVIIDSHFNGNVSERCIEFAALDRVVYNLINNSARFTSDSYVYFVILPVGEKQRDLRLVIYNRVTTKQRTTLQDRFGDHLSKLFYGGFTTGGNGLGLRICADFVADAYGLSSIEQALVEGYLGAQLIDDHFVSWFHWPVAAD